MKLRRRLLLIAALPLAAALALSIEKDVADYQRLSHEGEVATQIALVAEVSALIHDLQRERGFSAGFVGSEGRRFQNELRPQRLSTDASLESAESGLAAFESFGFDEARAFGTEIASLDRMRTAVSERSTSVPDLVSYYTGLIDELIVVTQRVLRRADDPALTDLASAYGSLIVVKERAGLERAMGAVGFGKGGFTHQDIARFSEYAGAERDLRKAVKIAHTTEVATTLKNLLSSAEHAELLRLRQIALRSLESGDMQGVEGKTWFATASAWIDRIKAAEDDLRPAMLETIEGLRASALRTLIFNVILTTLTTAAAIAVVFFVSRRLERETHVLSEELRRISENDLEREVEADVSTHEFTAIRDMAVMFRQMGLDAAAAKSAAEAAEKEKAEAEEAAAAAEAAEQEAAEAAAKAAALQEKERLEAQLKQHELEAERREHALAAEREKAAADKTASEDAERLRREHDRSEQLKVVLEALGRGLSRLSNGDLSQPLSEPFGEEFEGIRGNFNHATERLQALLTDITEGMSELGGNAEMISCASRDLATRTEKQAATLDHSAAAARSLSDHVGATAESATKTESFVNETRRRAESGSGVVRQAIEAMVRIEASSTDIDKIVTVIEDIAFQTNLLSLNAGVEAARAGESGRGFAVVATEVRSLAQRATDSAQEIKTLIAQSGEAVSSGVTLVRDTGDAFSEIVDGVEKIGSLVSDITESSRRQSDAINDLTSSIERIDDATQSNAAMAEETTAAAQTLFEEIGRVVAASDVFVLGDSGDASAGGETKINQAA